MHRISNPLLALAITAGALAAQATPLVVPDDPFAYARSMRARPSPTSGHRVVVIDDNTGEPLPGAVVVAVPSELLGPKSKKRLLWHTIPRIGIDDDRAFILAVLQGKRYAVDEQGTTVVPADQPMHVFALLGLSLDAARIAVDAEGPTELEIRPVPAIEVMVRDTRGNPAPDVPVQLTDSRRTWMPAFQSPFRTDRSGRAFVATVDDTIDTLTIWAPMEEPVRAPLAGARDGEPVEITLPPMGGLRVYADPPGSGTAVTATLRLSGSPPDAPKIKLQSVSGLFHFPWVPIGATFDLNLSYGSSTTQHTVTGPTRAQEIEIVELGELNAPRTIRARVLDLDGKPLSGRVTLVFRDRFRVHGRGARVKDGALELDLPPGTEDDFDLWVLNRRGDSMLGSAQVDTSRDGYDFGEVRLQPDVAVLRGKVVDTDGNPMPNFRLTAHHNHRTGRARSVWFVGGAQALRSINLTSDADGSFTLLGNETLAQAIRIDVRSDGWAQLDENEFVAGTDDALIRVTAAAEFRATLSEPLRGGYISTHLARDGQEVGVATRGEEVFADRLVPGTYTLVFEGADSEPFFEIPDIDLRPGAEPDPRLTDIDIAAFAKKLTIVDPDGAPIAGAQAYCSRITEGGGRISRTIYADRSQDDGGTSIVLWGDLEDCEVRIQHARYLTQSLETVDGDRTITLQPRPRLDIRITNMPELPAEARFRMRLGESARGNNGGYVKIDRATLRPWRIGQDTLRLVPAPTGKLRAAWNQVVNRRSWAIERRVALDSSPEQTLEITLDESELEDIAELVRELSER